MKVESHLLKLHEHLAGLGWGIRQNNHAAIGFHSSAASVELLSLLLHKKELISSGFQINHTWLKSKNIIGAKFNFDFPQKEEILALMKDIEDTRNPLCYGAPQPDNAAKHMAAAFFKLKEMIEHLVGEKYD